MFECEHNQTNLILSSYFKFEASYGLERQFNTIEILPLTYKVEF